MNINVRAAAMARSNLGHGLPTKEELVSCKGIISPEEGVDFLLFDLIESDTYDLLMIEARGWKKTLENCSEKQCRASWPDAMALFEEAGV